MSTPNNPKWKQKMDVTTEEYFNIGWWIPNINLVKMYREMEKELGKEKAQQIMKKIAHKFAEDETRQMYKDKKITCLRDYIDANSGSNPIYEKALIKEDIERSDEKREFKIHSCLWAKTWKELDALDIGYVWNCCADLVEAEVVNPKLKLTRKGTLMQGAPYCDFCYTWEK